MVEGERGGRARRKSDPRLFPLTSMLAVAMPSAAASYEPSPLSATPSEPEEGFLVLCLYDFDGQDPDQLSFRQGDVLRIVQTQDTGWWAALDPSESTIGWVPEEFVQRMSDEMLYTYTFVTNELETARASEFETGYESPQEQASAFPQARAPSHTLAIGQHPTHRRLRRPGIGTRVPRKPAASIHRHAHTWNEASERAIDYS